MIMLLLACAPSPEPPVAPPPQPAPTRSTRTVTAGGKYHRGPGVVVANGEPCKVERVDVVSGERLELFTVEGACPTHCVFEARMAICAEGTKIVRHAFGLPDLTLLQEPWVADAQRIVVAKDRSPRAFSVEDGVLKERVLLVTGSKVLRETPLVPGLEPSFRAELTQMAYDLDSLQADCPSGICRGFGEVDPASIAAFNKRHSGSSGQQMFGPGRALVFQTVDGHPHTPVELCDDPACTSFIPVKLADDAVSLLRHPPFLLVRSSSGAIEVFGFGGAPGRVIGQGDWATMLPFDLFL